MVPIKDMFSTIGRAVTAKKELEIAQLQSQLAEKERRIGELESEIRRRDEMTPKFPFYFKEDDPNPFCQTCWQVDRIQVQLDSPFKHTYGGVGYACRRCHNDFRLEDVLPGTKLAEFREDSSPVVSAGRSRLREGLDDF